MTPSITTGLTRCSRSRRLAVIALVLLTIGISGTAWAWFEGFLYTYRPAFLANTTVRVGCLGRMQSFSHGGSGSAGTLGLLIEAWDGPCKNRAPGNAVSGKSYVRFIKYKPGGFDFCGETYVVDTGGWKSSYQWTPPTQPASPPCGDGYYQVTSCSESHAYRKVTTHNEIVIGRTVEDCSNILNWSFSGHWHPWCSGCDPNGP